MLAIFTLFGITAAPPTENDCPQTLEECSPCNRTVAVCETTTTLIPSGMLQSIENLTILYTGRSVSITADMFTGLPQLRILSISGPVTELAENSFNQLSELVSLKITGSELTFLPNELFARNNTVRELMLDFSKSVTVTLPTNIFHQLLSLEALDLKGNLRFIVCPDSSDGLGAEFKYLTKLTQLSISNMEVNSSCVDNLNVNLFKNIPQVTRLSLHNTELFIRSKAVLSSLQTLEYLDLSNTRIFGECPNRAAELFQALPTSLATLTLQRWRTTLPTSPDCMINSTHLSGLKALPMLKYLNFKYSDIIFGFSLSPDLFNGFHTLSFLDIGWCRINVVEPFAFDGCPKLIELDLDGNPLGPRQFQLYSKGNQSFQMLSSLSLQRALISSDQTLTYDITSLLRNTPSIRTLDLRSNFLHYMPRILTHLPTTRPGQLPHTTHNISSLILDSNWLRHLYPPGVALKDHELCKILRNISHLSIRNNRLRNIFGLCPTLTHLFLENNMLHMDWDVNSQVIKSLSALEVLDLSSNQLTKLLEDLLLNMKNLKHIFLADNNITSLPKMLFDGNTALETIDLGDNNITSVEEWNISLLPKLKFLDLSGNSLTTLGKSFIQKIKASNLERVVLSGNKFTCVCHEDHLKDFLSETTIVVSARKITCTDPTTNRVEKITKYEQSPWQCTGQYVFMYMVQYNRCRYFVCLHHSTMLQVLVVHKPHTGGVQSYQE